jgi:hypothetical protein
VDEVEPPVAVADVEEAVEVDWLAGRTLLSSPIVTRESLSSVGKSKPF